MRFVAIAALISVEPSPRSALRVSACRPTVDTYRDAWRVDQRSTPTGTLGVSTNGRHLPGRLACRPTVDTYRGAWRVDQRSTPTGVLGVSTNGRHLPGVLGVWTNGRHLPAVLCVWTNGRHLPRVLCVSTSGRHLPGVLGVSTNGRHLPGCSACRPTVDTYRGARRVDQRSTPIGMLGVSTNARHLPGVLGVSTNGRHLPGVLGVSTNGRHLLRDFRLGVARGAVVVQPLELQASRYGCARRQRQVQALARCHHVHLDHLAIG